MNDPFDDNGGQVDPNTGNYDPAKGCPWNDTLENPPYDTLPFTDSLTLIA